MTEARVPVKTRVVNRKFVRHFVEMVAAMGIGMLVLEPLWMLATHAFGWAATFDRTVPMALAMATQMSIGMAAWMRFRGHGWAPTLEMCAAMFAPFLVLFVPLWAGLVGRGTVMLLGHLLMLPVMWAVMLRRREEYAAAHHRPARAAAGGLRVIRRAGRAGTSRSAAP